MLNSPNLPDGRGRVPYSPFTAAVPMGMYALPVSLPQGLGGFYGSGAPGEDIFRAKARRPFPGPQSLSWEGRLISPPAETPEVLASQPKSWFCRQPASSNSPGCEPTQSNSFNSERGASKLQLPKAQQASIAGKPVANQKNDPQSEEQPKVNGSKLIGAFKITSALVVTGAVNAFFFGVPIYVSSGIAAAVAGAQALAALKIHKEDTPFTQRLMAFTRKIMGRENDLTPAGKEWSMVPVWAGICGAFGLSEAFLNHVFKESTGYQKKSFEARKDAILQEIQRSRFGLQKTILSQQLKGMSFVESSRKDLMGKLSQWSSQEGLLGGVLKRTSQFLKRFNSGGAARPNYPLIYLWSLGMASFAGAAQTVLAALMQQKIDRANGIGKAS